MPGPLDPETEALVGGARGTGKSEAFKAELVDRLVALARGLQPGDWRAKYFGNPAARVFIVGNRLRVFQPVATGAGE